MNTTTNTAMNTPMNTKENIDQAELAKFSKMASHWWDLNGPCKPLHEINPIRLQFVKEQINLYDKNLIDVGCGGGIFSESLAAAGAAVTGIDPNHDLITVAKLHLHESRHKVDYHKSKVEEFAKKHPQNFDVITCMELLEHVPDPEAIIQNCVELAKPGSLIFFSTINRNLASYLKAIIGAEYVMKMLPPGTHDYDKFIKPSELCNAARKYGLELKALGGFGYNPLKKSYFAMDDVSVNYMACFQVPQNG